MLEGKVVVAVPEGVTRVRLEIENGSVDVDSGEVGELRIEGGLRRAADTAETLAAIEAVQFAFAAAPDPASPGTLVVRGPMLPAGVMGVLGVQAGIRMPASLPLDIQISGSGSVNVYHRAAETVVNTGRGDLRFGDCHGDVVGRTGRGNVIAFGQEGRLDLNAKTGDIQALVKGPRDRIRVVTTHGNVQLMVPPATGFDVDARAETGRVGNGFGLPVTKVGDYSAAMVGKVGDASVKVVLRSVSGNVWFTGHEFR